MSAPLRIAAPVSDWSDPATIAEPRYWEATATGWRLTTASGERIRPLTASEEAMARALLGRSDVAPLADLSRVVSPVASPVAGLSGCSEVCEGARVLPHGFDWVGAMA